MKRYFFSIVLLSGWILSIGQICKYEVNEVDPLTDEVIRTVNHRITGPLPYYIIDYKRYGSAFQLDISVGDFGELTDVIEKGSEIIFRTGSGDIFKSETKETINPSSKENYGDIITSYELSYEITEEAMKKIAETGITFIRISDLKNTFGDLKFPDVATDISIEKASCLFKESKY
jgi:nicotinate-nucleotide pyrophosphorylase